MQELALSPKPKTTISHRRLGQGYGSAKHRWWRPFVTSFISVTVPSWFSSVKVSSMTLYNVACLAIGLDLDNSIFFGLTSPSPDAASPASRSKDMITEFGVPFFRVIVDVSISSVSLPIEVSILSPSNVSGSSASADVGDEVRQNASTKETDFCNAFLNTASFTYGQIFPTCLTIAGKAHSFCRRYHTVGTRYEAPLAINLTFIFCINYQDKYNNLFGMCKSSQSMRVPVSCSRLRTLSSYI